MIMSSTTELDFDRLTEGLSSKSEKIRELARHGVPTADIARYLDIRYQHARNVLVQSGLHRLRGETEPSAVEGGAGQSSRTATSSGSAWVDLDTLGRLQLPKELLEAAGLRGGTKVYVGVNEDAIEILSPDAALDRAHKIVSRLVPPGVSLVDELIAERRREALMEEERSS
jgi:bifunctional DNA-binding transcriptional regulator/antitoxin component of YhaV-PrlF toxin-antitoxin module